MPEGSGALELAKELIARRSVTPEDGGCQELIAARLAKAGFRCEPMKFGEVANLWARRGAGHPVVCFAGHTDVVPTGPLTEWHSDPFVPTVRDGKLYGRGAADMKSSIAAFVIAAERFVAELARTQWDKGNESFPPTSFQVSNIHAGTGAGNVVPGSVAVDFNFRFSTESTEASLRQRVEAMLQKHGLDYALDWTLGAKPFLSKRGRLADIVLEAGKRHAGSNGELATTGGTSDARIIIDICPEVIEMGPVNASIHKLNEHIALDELEILPLIYLDTLRSLLDAG